MPALPERASAGAAVELPGAVAKSKVVTLFS
jgi:hypothetical protein